jgi:hypothetical protein
MSADPHSFHLFDLFPPEQGATKPEQKAVVPAEAVEFTDEIGASASVADLPAPQEQESEVVKGWPDNLRQAPNPLIRCGLFTVGNNKIARAHWGAKSPARIDAYGTMSVAFQGEEFRQDDLDVLLEILQVVRGQPIDARAKICPAHFIRDMGWTKNKTSYERLKACIVRLQMGVISIKIYLNKEKTESFTYNGSLVKDSSFHEDSKAAGNNRWSVLLDSRLYKFFHLKDYTRLNWDHRKQIHAPLGKFLHAFFSSHDGRFPIPVEKVMSLAGYRNLKPQAINKFRFDMKKYLDEMKGMGAIQDWRMVDGDKVAVTPVRFSLPKPAKTADVG